MWTRHANRRTSVAQRLKWPRPRAEQELLLASSLQPTLLPGVGPGKVVLRKDEPRNKSSSPGG